MMVSIDYIMSLLDWNNSTEQQTQGIELAKRVKCLRFQKLYKLRELIQSICGLPVQVVYIEFGTIGHVVTPFPFKLLLLFSFKFDNVVQLAVQ